MVSKKEPIMFNPNKTGPRPTRTSRPKTLKTQSDLMLWEINTIGIMNHERVRRDAVNKFQLVPKLLLNGIYPVSSLWVIE